jgi:hypothetical protein
MGEGTVSFAPEFPRDFFRGATGKSKQPISNVAGSTMTETPDPLNATDCPNCRLTFSRTALAFEDTAHLSEHVATSINEDQSHASFTPVEFLF